MSVTFNTNTLKYREETTDPWAPLMLHAEAELEPTDFITTGLTFNECSRERGGYVLIGNILIMNIVIKPTAVSTGLKNYISLGSSIKPKSDIAMNCINITDDLGPYYCLCGSSGAMWFKNLPTANKEYSVCGVYLLI